MASPKPISLTQVSIDDYDEPEAPQPFVVVGPVPGGGGGGSTAWGDITGKPVVIAAGATQAAARAAISAVSEDDISGVVEFLGSQIDGKQPAGDYTLNSSLRLPIVLTREQFDSLNPPVPGQVYLIERV